MAMNTVRRIASEMLGAGENKVKFRTDSLPKIGEALTREDIRMLIKDGAVYAESKRGVSRLRMRTKDVQKRKGRRTGAGSRKGTKSARLDSKTEWIAKVRSQRDYLAGLVENKKIDPKSSRKIYMMIKGNAFKGVKVLEAYLKDNKMLI